MRVLLDANIFISYLLTAKKSESIHVIINAMLQGKFTVLITNNLFNELNEKIKKKKYLAKRIEKEDIDELMRSLRLLGEEIVYSVEEIYSIVRDPKDDYLVTCAVLGQADYLVTGDDDLLSLKQIEKVKMITPKKFLKILKEKSYG